MDTELRSRATPTILLASSHSRHHNKVHRVLRVWFVGLICAGIASYAVTPQTVSAQKLLLGIVTTQDAQPLAKATVEIVDALGNSVGKSETDSDGRFEIITDSPAGGYELIITHRGQLNAEQISLARSELRVNVIVATSTANKSGDSRYTVSARQLSISERTRARLTAAQRDFERGRTSGAMEQLQAVMEMSPSCSEAWSMRAFIRMSMRDIAGATADALHAQELDSGNADAFLALASAYNASRMFPEAETALQRALQLRPNSWQARLELAKTWYGERRFALALRQLELIERDFPDVHLVRANTLVSLGRNSEAAKEFRTFLQEAPTDSRALQIQQIVAQFDRRVGAQDPD
jgi:Tfp pilus assembly protein PilF